jgi:endonuclease III related protein
MHLRHKPRSHAAVVQEIGQFSVSPRRVPESRSASPSHDLRDQHQPGALQDYYAALSAALGPMHWWPARTSIEMIVGAILTQSTAWSNVERAIENLRRERLLTFAALERVPLARLQRLVRPSGYFRQKARKLKAFVEFLRNQHGGSLARMFRTPTSELREQLLSVHGIGRETADSILLYAGRHPVFVVDAYTHRILERHAFVHGKPEYERAREFFESRLPRDAALYNEFHALIVNTGKNWCRKSAPRCGECPLAGFLPPDSPLKLSPAMARTEVAAEATL